MTAQTQQPAFLTFWNKALSRDGWERRLTQFLLVFLAVAIVFSGSIIIGATHLGALVLAGLVAVIIFVNVFLHPSVGLYLVVGITYLNLSWIATDAFGIPSLIRPLMAFIFVSVVATRNILQNKRFIFRQTEMALLFYLVVLAFSSFVGDQDVNHTLSLNAILDIGKDLLMMVIVVQLSYDEKVWKRTIWVLLLSAAFVSSFTWYHFVTGDYANDFIGFATSRTDAVGGMSDSEVSFYRSGGQIGDPNFYAQTLTMVIPIAIALMLFSFRKYHRMLAFLCLAAIVGAIVFTYSRGGLVVMVIISLITLYWLGVNMRRLIFLSVLVGALALPILPSSYIQRVTALLGIGGAESSQTTDVSLLGRTSELLVALQMFQNRPILGIGYSLYENYYLQYSSQLGLDDRFENRAAHSLYLEALAETGIVGVSALLFMYFVIYRSAFAAIRTLGRIERADLIPWLKALVLSLSAYLMTSVLLHDAFGHYLRLCIALVLGMTALVDHLERQYELEQRAIRAKNYNENLI